MTPPLATPASGIGCLLADLATRFHAFVGRHGLEAMAFAFTLALAGIVGGLAVVHAFA
ncbi:hypothetical protein D9M73_238010 [compost metagenome]